MTNIYILNCTEFTDIVFSLENRISEERQKRSRCLRKESDRLLCIGAEICLAYSLALPLPLKYDTLKNGKPFIKGQRHFSISHSGDYVICAVSDEPLGADIEKISRMSPALSKKIFSPVELEKSRTLDGSELQKYLCRVWTQKESFVKLTGEGLRQNLRTICTEEPPTEKEQNSPYFFTQSFGEDYLISVCLGKESEVYLSEISTTQLAKHFFTKM